MQQDIENIRVGFFNLIKQNYLIRPAAHCLGQKTALIIADVSRRRTNQPGDCVLLHVFGHINPQHGALVIKQKLRQRLAQFRLADTGGTQEQERANRLTRIRDTGARTTHGVGNSGNRFFLPDDTFGQKIFHMQQFFFLALKHFINRNPRPLGDDIGNVFFGYGFREAVFMFLGIALGNLNLALQLRDNAVLQLAGAFKPPFALGNFNLYTGFVELVFEAGEVRQPLFFLAPFFFQRFGLGLQTGDFISNQLTALFGLVIGFFFDALALNFQLQNTAVKFIQLLGLGINRHSQRACRLVHQVNGFVRQKAVTDIAVRQRGGSNQRAVRNFNPVVEFKFFLDAAENRNCLLNIRLADINRLKTPRQRGIFLNIFFILIEGGSAEAVQLPPGQSRLEQVRGIHRAFRGTGADQCVHLINKQDDAAL